MCLDLLGEPIIPPNEKAKTCVSRMRCLMYT